MAMQTQQFTQPLHISVSARIMCHLTLWVSRLLLHVPLAVRWAGSMFWRSETCYFLTITNGHFAFDVDAIVSFNALIPSCVIPFLLPFLAICWPDFFGVVNMSIKGLKRFHDDSSCSYFVVSDSAPVLPDPDEGSRRLTYESPPSTHSDQPRKKKATRVRFLDDSEVTGFRYKFGYPPLRDSSVE